MKYTLAISALLASCATSAQVKVSVDPTECKQMGLYGEIAYEEAGVTNVSTTHELKLRCPIPNPNGKQFSSLEIWKNPHRTVYCSLVRRHWEHYANKPTLNVKDFTLSSYPGFLLQSVSASGIGGSDRDIGTAYHFECRIPAKSGNNQSYLGAYTYIFN
ncbi:hypothetical protein [Pseudoalteromonas luteoviolacea]|uniref:Ig-like domain-containing protein n=1 Tax=Pseudoalteromonas luteoviolacea NCIMB 1942 TaxID=1365253 RepID=A0A167A1T8_9GAMM|nr:hypothetical protein [Pseudoalteromonas luteoviolacea]KZN44900.1 hypothetical protein N482_02575 [Pseudoalteromonas luteoviolacea NCIMB 1942]KZX02216.1 hypothetical protein JL49_01460 [Pseudoalteromonas luteoviolacea]